VVAPEPSGEPVHRSQFRLEVLLAAIAAAAALVAAGLSVWATFRTADTQQQESRRAERVEAYAELVASVQAMQLGLDEADRTCLTHDASWPMAEELSQEWEALELTVARVQMLGSPDTRSLAVSLREELAAAYRAHGVNTVQVTVAGAAPMETKTPAESSCGSFHDALAEQVGPIDVNLDWLIAKSAADLGTLRIGDADNWGEDDQ